MTLTFQVEQYVDVINEIIPYYPMHYEELASDKSIPLDPDFEGYLWRAEKGLLQVVTARKDGELVGYYIAFISPHIHYRHSLTAHVDIYYLRKDCRIGANGLDFLRFAEQSLVDRAVERIYVSTKTDSDKSAIFEWLGYQEKERVFTKLIGG